MPGRDVETHGLSPVMPATNLSTVMPGFMPGIHVLAVLQQQRRGWHRKSGLPDFRINY